MSRVTYAFNETVARQHVKPQGRRLQMPMRSKLRNRRYLRSAVETAGLFVFGFGATGLLMHFAAGYYLLSGGLTMAPSIFS